MTGSISRSSRRTSSDVQPRITNTRAATSASRKASRDDDAPFFTDGVVEAAKKNQAKLAAKYNRQKNAAIAAENARRAAAEARSQECVKLLTAITTHYEKDPVVKVAMETLSILQKAETGRKCEYYVAFGDIGLILTRFGFTLNNGEILEKTERVDIGKHATSAAARLVIDEKLARFCNNPEATADKVEQRGWGYLYEAIAQHDAMVDRFRAQAEETAKRARLEKLPYKHPHMAKVPILGKLFRRKRT